MFVAGIETRVDRGRVHDERVESIGENLRTERGGEFSEESLAGSIHHRGRAGHDSSGARSEEDATAALGDRALRFSQDATNEMMGHVNGSWNDTQQRKKRTKDKLTNGTVALLLLTTPMHAK